MAAVKREKNAITQTHRYCSVKACVNYHSCDTFLNQNPNKQSTAMQRNLVSSCISFRGGSGKTWKVKNVKWQKVWVLGKQISSVASAILAISIHLSKFRPILVDVVHCRRERRDFWQAVRRKRGKTSQIFACILLKSNHMVFLVQFGINRHS